jgi:hypothetical protein
MRKGAAVLAFLGLFLCSAALPCFAATLADDRMRTPPMEECEGPPHAGDAALCAEPGFAAPIVSTPHDLPQPPVVEAVPAAGPSPALPQTSPRPFPPGGLSPPWAAAPAYLLHSALLI